MLEVIHESDNGLVIPPETTFDQWLDIGTKLNRAGDKLAFIIGDWIAYGSTKKWGSKYAEAITATGIDHGTLRAYASVSNRVALVDRINKLTWTHHHAVAALTIQDQRRWLASAVEHSLDVAELKASIEAGHVVRKADIQAERAAKAGLYSPQAVRMTFLSAFRQATSKRDVKSWPKPMRDAWKVELKPIADLYAQL